MHEQQSKDHNSIYKFQNVIAKDHKRMVVASCIVV